jgi:hypothetical protein
MESSAPTRRRTAFTDGLGERVVSVVGIDAREVLRLTAELSARPEFELALRERATRLATLDHEALPRVRAVERNEGDGRLSIVSEYVPGVRLSDLLATAERESLPLEFDGALCLLRRMFPAVAALHERLSTSGHGAIAPERVVVGPDGRLTVVEHVLGGALERLQYSRERYWRDLRVALPQTVGLSRFDVRSDVTQVGIVALSLFLGRCLRADEYPAQVQDVVNSASARSSGGISEPLSPGMRDWLVRTLQIDSRRSFASIAEARAGLEAVAGYADPVAEPRALVSFLAQCARSNDASQPPAAPPVVVATAAAPNPLTVPASARPVVMAPQAAGASKVAWATAMPAAPERVAAARVTSVAPTSASRVVSMAASVDAAVADPLLAPSLRAQQEQRDDMTSMTSWPRHWLIAAAAVLIAVTTGATMLGRRMLTPAAAAAMGTLVVGTNPEGVAVLVDGKNSGTTPLTISLTPGQHVLEIVTETEHRRTTVNIAPGAQVSQFLELPKNAPGLGDLQVRTEPSRAKVTVDGHFFGQSPITVKGLSPGLHQVLLENEAGAVTEQVTIERGTTAALLVPMTRPQSSFASGWISVTAPADLQVYEDERLLGSSRSDRIMVSVGRHDLELVNESLGFRASRTVQVTAGQVTPVRPEWPKGTVALNALPWAEVFIGGERIGETPLGNVSLPVGMHEVVFKHPELGEKRAMATVTAGAASKVSVDLRK